MKRQLTTGVMSSSSSLYLLYLSKLYNDVLPGWYAYHYQVPCVLINLGLVHWVWVIPCAERVYVGIHASFATTFR